MASSSTSSVPKSFEYDVFLSFRGQDTRKNFVDHLHYALQQKGIQTFKDDENMKQGERIGDELVQAIENSRFYIIVFSKNYASSSWCLDELVKIMEECQKTTEQKAYPVFYDVEPTEVRKQSGAVGQAFAKHKNEDDARKWRAALEKAAGIIGWDLKTISNGHEAKFIQQIVAKILFELHSINFSDDEELVGMGTRIDDVVSSLEIGLDDVRMIGIKGMGGGGKTTLAEAVFNQISFLFEGKSFVYNVRELSNSSSGLKSLQQQLLKEVSNVEITVSSVLDGKIKMKKMMFGKKVLVVLDDVDRIDQLAALARKNWFGPGSRVIITTRDEQVLIAHGVDLIRYVNLLSDDEAICLFSRHAFRRDIPIQGYEELSRQVVCYAAGLPLTVKVLGSFLCGKDELEWIDALKRLETIPLKETLEILELSYNGLENDYKEMFLNVACIMNGWRKDEAIRALESCGFQAIIGIKVLMQKSLITVTNDYCGDEYLHMHDRIEEMAKNIVRRLHPDDPYRHSRLWFDDEIENILANDLGTEATRYIKQFIWKLDPKLLMKGLGNMNKLRFLDVFFGRIDDSSGSDWKFDEVSPYLPNALRYLRLAYYPFRYLPKTFQANDLVALQLSGSRIEHLWEEGERKVFKKLRFLDLFYINWKTIDLGLMPNLETLRLEGCDQLVELHMHVGCPKLKSIDIENSKLKSLDLGRTPNLKTLVLKGCCDLVELHMNSDRLKLESLEISFSKLSHLDLRHTPNLETLKVFDCMDLEELHLPVGCSRLKSLDINSSKLRTLDQSLDISSSKLTTLDLRHTMNLERLTIRHCKDLVELHMPVECLKLISLFLSSSKLSTLDLRPFPNLKTLYLVKCNDLEELHMPVRCLNLKLLNVKGSKLTTLDLGRTPNLEKLDLVECVASIELHIRDNNNVQLGEGGERKVLDKLKFLRLNYSKLKTVDLGLTPNLEELSLDGCCDLVKLHMPIACLSLKSLNIKGLKLTTLDLGSTQDLQRLSLVECVDLVELHMPVELQKLISLNLNLTKLRIFDLGGTPNLEELFLKGCYDLEKLHMPVECPKLKLLFIKGSKLTTLDLGHIQHLGRLDLYECVDLVELHMPVKCLKLISLDLNLPKLRTFDLGGTPNLEKLSLKGCCDLEKLHMPNGCPKLKFLDIIGSKLTTLDLRHTLHLEALSLVKCVDLVELHMPGESLKLGNLNLNLPKLRTLDLGLVPNLMELDLGGCDELAELHMPIRCPELMHLALSGSKLKTLDLGLTPNLRTLRLKKCYNFVDLHVPVGCLKRLIQLELSGCSKIISFLLRKMFDSLEDGLLAESYLIAESVDICLLHSENNLPEFLFKRFDREDLLSLIRNLGEHIPAGPCACINLKSLGRSSDSPRWFFGSFE